MARGLIGLGIFLAMTGCSVVGTWDATGSTPGSPFHQGWVTFRSDKTYTAGYNDAEAETSTGTYEHAGDDLTLTTSEGHIRKYGVTMKSAEKMEVTGQEGGKDVSVMMNKRKCKCEGRCMCPKGNEQAKACPHCKGECKCPKT